MEENPKRIAAILLADLVLTASISGAAIIATMYIQTGWGREISLFADCSERLTTSANWLFAGVGRPSSANLDEVPRSLGYYQVSFYTAFLTSAWLWLYAVSVIVSRILTRTGEGVGFLLKITDVENQPFRSIGFTSVVLVSLMFLAGLPFVLMG